MKEINHTARISKTNIFIKILSVKEFNQDGMNHLLRISKINIFIKNCISVWVQPRWDEPHDSNF